MTIIIFILLAIEFDEISLKLYTNCTIKYMVYIHVSSTKVNDSIHGKL